MFMFHHYRIYNLMKVQKFCSKILVQVKKKQKKKKKILMKNFLKRIKMESSETIQQNEMGKITRYANR